MKAHGALYNMAARDRPLADVIARATRAYDPSLVLFGLPGSEFLPAGEAAGCGWRPRFSRTAPTPRGSLAPRTAPGSVIHDPGRWSVARCAW